MKRQRHEVLVPIRGVRAVSGLPLIVCAGLLLALAAPAQAAPASVVLAGVTNETSYAKETLAAQAGEALQVAFTKSAEFRVVPLGEAAAGLSPAELASPAGLAQVAAKAQADAALFTRILEAQVGGDQAKVVIETLWAEAGSEMLRLRTRVAGSVPKRPSIQDGAAALIGEALRNACETTALEAAATLSMTGAIVSAEGPTVSPGQGGGLRAGSEIVVLRRGRVIAHLEAVKVANTYAECRIIEGTARAALRAGDQVRVLYNPSPTTTPPSKQMKRRFISDEGLITLLVGGLLWWLADEAKGDEAGPVTGARIEVLPSATEVVADGFSHVDVVARVTDAQGKPVPDGTMVGFGLSTTEGNLTNVGMISPASAPTASGEARAVLTAGTEPKTVTITAQVGTLQGTAAVKYTAGQTGAVAGAPEAVTLMASVPAVQANGNDFSTITARVVDATGAPCTNGTVVQFSAFVTVVLPAGGTDTEPTTITPTATTAAGNATAILVSRDPTTNLPNRPGSVTVTATVGPQTAPIPSPTHTVTNSSPLVQYVSQSVAAIALGANPTNIRGLDRVGETAAILAVVSDANHNPVVDGTAVYFTADRGLIYGNAGTYAGVAASTTANGQATATLVSAADGTDPTFDGWVTVHATVGGLPGTPGVIAQSTMLIFSGPATDTNSTLQLSDTQMNSIKDSIVITVTALDRNGQPVVDGTAVSVQADKGDLESTELTTTGGVAQTVVRSSTGELGAPPTATGTGVIEVTIATGGVPVRLSATYLVVP